MTLLVGKDSNISDFSYISIDNRLISTGQLKGRGTCKF